MRSLPQSPAAPRVLCSVSHCTGLATQKLCELRLSCRRQLRCTPPHACPSASCSAIQVLPLTHLTRHRSSGVPGGLHVLVSRSRASFFGGAVSTREVAAAPGWRAAVQQAQQDAPMPQRIPAGKPRSGGGGAAARPSERQGPAAGGAAPAAGPDLEAGEQARRRRQRASFADLDGGCDAPAELPSPLPSGVRPPVIRWRPCENEQLCWLAVHQQERRLTSPGEPSNCLRLHAGAVQTAKCKAGALAKCVAWTCAGGQNVGGKRPW